MSISKLFTDFRNSSRNYSEYDTEKTFFQDVESISNAVALEIKARTYVPQLDYSRPENFIKFGSAELFYKGAVNRIVDYYPYDGSEAERNEFYNNLFDGEKYKFNLHFMFRVPPLVKNTSLTIYIQELQDMLFFVLMDGVP